MNLTNSNIKPFFSLLLAEIREKCSILELSNCIIEVIKKESEDPDGFIYRHIESGNVNSEAVNQEFIAQYSTIHYEIKKPPTWAKGTDIKDHEHHILSVISAGSYCAIYISEKGVKDKIRDNFSMHSVKGLTSVNVHKLFSIFINEDNIKMLWLLGTQSRNSSKAQSKVLAGRNVADTLDPLADQSYTLSAARTEISSSQEPVSMGINPYKSSIWHGQCSDWNKFENKVVEILNILNLNTHFTDANLSILAEESPQME